ncbi:MAG: sorbosone dehydrogenase family protein [Segetibacter sp.]|nr:sorbosone dehydrogenase family protein [Segetibacter sp.]
MKQLRHLISALVLLVVVMSCNSNRDHPTPITENNVKPDELYKKYNLDKISLPPGFSISVFAELPNARSMCWGAKGTLFVGNRDGENVYAVVDDNKDGKADEVYKIGSNLHSPNGVAFRNGSLYVAEINRIIRYDNIEDKLGAPPAPVVVTDKYPDRSHHGWKYIAFGPDDKLYVPVGAPCNVCEEKDSIFATITRMNPDGSNLEIFAKGIRNSVGFDWNPETKELWFTDNGRDQMGDDKPFCELNYAPAKGMHFGFPYCHQGDILDPEFGVNKNCADYVAPARKLGPHVAPLGMRFYNGSNFPSTYKNQIFIAEHGSWNRSIPIGYQVTVAKMQGNKVVDYTPFATGWLQKDGTVLGRPVDIKIAEDGAMLVSDDYKGAIYRIAYNK